MVVDGARKVQRACAGDGNSRDPFWKKCWQCCGRGDYPELATDVLPTDIGMGVGMGIEYDGKSGDRKFYVLTGVRGRVVLGRPPARGALPYPAGEFAVPVVERRVYVLNGFLIRHCVAFHANARILANRLSDFFRST